MSRGALAPAVAGSMAIPGLIQPVAYEGRFLIDGGAVNPLALRSAVRPRRRRRRGRRHVWPATARGARAPTPFQSMFGAAQIMQGAITAQKLKMRPPDILVRPGVEQFGVLDFLRVGQILRAAETAKDELKRATQRALRGGAAGLKRAPTSSLAPRISSAPLIAVLPGR